LRRARALHTASATATRAKARGVAPPARRAASAKTRCPNEATGLAISERVAALTSPSIRPATGCGARAVRTRARPSSAWSRGRDGAQESVQAVLAVQLLDAFGHLIEGRVLVLVERAASVWTMRSRSFFHAASPHAAAAAVELRERDARGVAPRGVGRPPGRPPAALGEAALSDGEDQREVRLEVGAQLRLEVDRDGEVERFLAAATIASACACSTASPSRIISSSVLRKAARCSGSAPAMKSSSPCQGSSLRSEASPLSSS
jgi:hypothetical protein